MNGVESQGLGRSYLDFSQFTELKTAARNRDPDAAPQVARQFEALFVQYAVDAMRDAGFGGGLLDNEQGALYRDLLDKQIAVEIAKTGALGFAGSLAPHLAPAAENPAQVVSDHTRGIAASNPGSPAQHGLAGATEASLEPERNAMSNGFAPANRDPVSAPVEITRRLYSQRKTQGVDIPTVHVKTRPPSRGGNVHRPGVGDTHAFAGGGGIDGFSAPSTHGSGNDSAPGGVFVNRVYSQRKTPGVDNPTFFARGPAPADTVDAPPVPATPGSQAGRSTPLPETHAAVAPSGVTATGTTIEHAPPAPVTPDVGAASIAASREAFVAQLWPMAVRAGVELGVSPSLILAQAALESGWGQAMPGGRGEHGSFNLFGIKTGPRWSGARTTAGTTEIHEGRASRTESEFRVYPSFADSFSDYVTFLKTNPRYRQALAADTSEEFIHGLQRAGYATDPDYGRKVMEILRGPELRVARSSGLDTT